MSRQFRTRTMQPRFAAVLGGVVVLTALIVVAVAAARPLAPSGQASPLSSAAATAHPCLVMTGSGDPAFVKNFNPFTATGLPERPVRPGRGLRRPHGLARGRQADAAVARAQLEVEQRQQDADASDREGRQVVRRQGSDRAGRGLQPARRPPGQDDGHPRHHPPRDERGLGQGEGLAAVVIDLKTPDSQFIAATLNGVIVIPQHIWSKVKDPATFTNPNPVGSGPFTRITRFTTQDYVLSKNLRYWQKGKPLIKPPRVRAGIVERRGPRADPERAGRLNANFVPNVDKAYTAKDKRTTTPSTRRRHTRSRSSSTTTSTLQPRRLPSRAVDGDRPQHRVEAR